MRVREKERQKDKGRKGACVLTSCAWYTGDVESEGILTLLGGLVRILRRVGGEIVERGQRPSLDLGGHSGEGDFCLFPPGRAGGTAGYCLLVYIWPMQIGGGMACVRCVRAVVAGE